MQHCRPMFALSLVTVCLFAAPRHACAQTAQSLHSKGQVNPAMLEMARKKLSLEEQLAEAHLRYTDMNPRISLLREQIVNFDQVITPRAMSLAITYRLEELQSERVNSQYDLLQAQKKYTPDAPQLQDPRQRLADINARIQTLQQQKRILSRHAR